MLCPDNNTEMHEVIVKSHYGQNIVLEQCGVCGGIWFDKAELHRARQGESKKIDTLNLEMLNKPKSTQKKEFRCPKDQSILTKFKDPYFPKDIIMERCGVCDGCWLNRGEFINYQEGRKELRREENSGYRNKKTEELVNKALEKYSENEKMEALNHLGSFLSTPVSLDTRNPKSLLKSAVLAVVSMMLGKI